MKWNAVPPGGSPTIPTRVFGALPDSRPHAISSQHDSQNLHRTPAPALGLRNDRAEPGRAGIPKSENRQSSEGGDTPMGG